MREGSSRCRLPFGVDSIEGWVLMMRADGSRPLTANDEAGEGPSRCWMALLSDSRCLHSTLSTFNVLGGECMTITQLVCSVSLEKYGRTDQIFHRHHRTTLTYHVGRRLPTPSKRMSRGKKTRERARQFSFKKIQCHFWQGNTKFGSTNKPSLTQSYVSQQRDQNYRRP